MNFLKMRFFIGIFGLFLIGCATRGLVPVAPSQSLGCETCCYQRYVQCAQVCQDNCKTCSQVADHTMKRHYQRYMNEVCLRGIVVTRDLQSYRDPLQCRKNTCSCLADYSVCNQACAGKINKRLQAAPRCC